MYSDARGSVKVKSADPREHPGQLVESGREEAHASEVDLRELFQPFRQVDTGLSRQHDGTGLGLAICRRLATLMGGTIGAASEIGRGSEFTVLLPLEGARREEGHG